MVRNAFERGDEIYRVAMEGGDNYSGNTDREVQFLNVAESSVSTEAMHMSTESLEETAETEADDLYEDAVQDLEARFGNPLSFDSDSGFQSDDKEDDLEELVGHIPNGQIGENLDINTSTLRGCRTFDAECLVIFNELL